MASILIVCYFCAIKCRQMAYSFGGQNWGAAQKTPGDETGGVCGGQAGVTGPRAGRPISFSLAAGHLQVYVVIERGHRLVRTRFRVVGPHHGVIRALGESCRGDPVGERLAFAVFGYGDRQPGRKPGAHFPERQFILPVVLTVIASVSFCRSARATWKDSR